MEKSTVERSLDASIKDGAAYYVMMGLGELYVGACAVYLGAPDWLVGLLSTVPLFLGACAQALTPPLIDRTGRRRVWYMAGSWAQAVTWLPMIAALWVPRAAGVWILLGSFVLYFASVQFTVPAWTSVMGDLVPAKTRGRYFGRRNAVGILVQFVATLLAGYGLRVFKQGGHEERGFTLIFAGAFLARLASIYYLSRMEEPPYNPRREDKFTLVQFFRRLPQSNFAKFVVFVACMNASAHFVGCLFNVYFLRTLKYPYWWQYTTAVSMIIVVQIPALVFWGRIADRYGNKKVLVTTAVGVAVLPALWLGSTHIAWACLLQLWSGFFWSGFNQSVLNFLLDAVTPPKRARCTAYLNLVSSFGILVGGVAGSLAIRFAPDHLGPFSLQYPFWALLFVSFLLRMTTIVFFLPLFREVRDVPRIGVFEMLFDATRESAESAVNLVAGLTRTRRQPKSTDVGRETRRTNR